MCCNHILEAICVLGVLNCRLLNFMFALVGRCVHLVKNRGRSGSLSLHWHLDYFH
jgi:hypothetical protein